MGYISTVLADIPVTGSFWQFNEASGTLVDSGGGAHNSTDNTSLLYRQTGPFLPDDITFGLGMDGVASTTGYGASVYEFLGNVSYSVEIWYKPSDLSNNPFPFQKQGAGGSEGWYVRVLTSGAIRAVRIQASVLDTLDSAAGVVKVGSWAHIVVTYDGTNQTIYGNGVLVAGPTASAKVIQTNTNNFSIGGLSAAGNKSAGVLALPAVYPGVVLNSTQVATHYAFYKPPGSLRSFNPVPF